MYFKLFSDCFPVKGIVRSVIYDTSRNDFAFIPNEVYDILVYHHRKTVEEIKKVYDNEYDETIDEYFDFLIKKEYIFYCSAEELDSFPKINTKYEQSCIISNAIIDVNENSKHDYLAIVKQLVQLQCMFVQIRFYNSISYQKLTFILDNFTDGIAGIDLLLPFCSEEYNTASIRKLIENYPLVKIEFHSINEQNFHKDMRESVFSIPVLWFNDKIKDHTHCGLVDQKYFRVNRELFFESQNYNSCLHKKISIDVDGNIKNCPSLPYTYGNLSDSSLLAIVHKKEFKKLWKIKKDHISVCNVCEFRYMCVDCRAHIADSADIYSKPAKCSYDPYTAKWIN